MNYCNMIFQFRDIWMSSLQIETKLLQQFEATNSLEDVQE